MFKEKKYIYIYIFQKQLIQYFYRNLSLKTLHHNYCIGMASDHCVFLNDFQVSLLLQKLFSCSLQWCMASMCLCSLVLFNIAVFCKILITMATFIWLSPVCVLRYFTGIYLWKLFITMIVLVWLLTTVCS